MREVAKEYGLDSSGNGRLWGVRTFRGVVVSFRDVRVPDQVVRASDVWEAARWDGGVPWLILEPYH